VLLGPRPAQAAPTIFKVPEYPEGLLIASRRNGGTLMQLMRGRSIRDTMQPLTGWELQVIRAHMEDAFTSINAFSGITDEEGTVYLERLSFDWLAEARVEVRPPAEE
jgi:hypothetical protein